MVLICANRGRAAFTGTSYDGWTAVMAALDPHPAVKAIVEQASPADMFLGDDFHHNGAFRLSYGFEYSAELETSSTENYSFQFDRADTFEWYLGLGPLSNVDERHFHGKIPTWEDFVHHPNYDEFWKRQAFARYLTAVKVPMAPTGVVMPQMTGFELGREVTARTPGVENLVYVGLPRQRNPGRV
jgi:predicted acyl esterase